MSRLHSCLALCCISVAIALAPVSYADAVNTETSVPPASASLEREPGPGNALGLSRFTAPRTFRPVSSFAPLLLGLVILLAGAAWFLAANIRQPRRISLQPLELSEEERARESPFMRNTTEKLESLGFSRSLDFTVPELPHPGFYRYMASPTEEYAAILYEIQPAGGKAGQHVGEAITCLEFRSVLEDGLKVNTSNNAMDNYVVVPDDQAASRLAGEENPMKLFEYHTRRTAELAAERGTAIRLQSPAEFRRTFIAEWDKMLEHQIEQGFLRPDKEGKTCHGTMKLILSVPAPRSITENRASLGLLYLLSSALLMLLVVWSMPSIVRLLGFGGMPVAAKELEAVTIFVAAALPACPVGTGGILIGVLGYIPTAVILEPGPLGTVVPVLSALIGGSVGAKISERSGVGGRSTVVRLIPEAVGLIVLLYAVSTNYF